LTYLIQRTFSRVSDTVSGEPIIARFDDGQLSSDGGVLALREIERRLGVADRLAACVAYPRAAERVVHCLADILRFRMLMIATGYEDGDDANSLRHDPAFKLALSHLPNCAALCSQTNISRLENLPRPRDLLPMGQAMVGLYCDSFRRSRDALRSTPTTPSTQSMAASSCGCSTPTTTNNTNTPGA